MVAVIALAREAGMNTTVFISFSGAGANLTPDEWVTVGLFSQKYDCLIRTRHVYMAVLPLRIPNFPVVR